eukprot:5253387-Amphidinium_carterae.2
MGDLTPVVLTHYAMPSASYLARMPPCNKERTERTQVFIHTLTTRYLFIAHKRSWRKTLNFTRPGHGVLCPAS